MELDLRDKVLVLTGGGGGIGRAVAVKLAACRMKIALLGGRNVEKLDAVRAEVEKHSRCMVIPGELDDPEFLRRSVKSVADAFGGIDVLVNNAGAAQSTPFDKISPEEFDRLMSVNVRAPFFLTQAALPYLKRSGSATVVNIASVVAHSGYPLQSVYSASKHALLGWTKSFARECCKDGIRVHAISPGGVYTDMVKLSRPDLSPEGMIMPEEVAEIVHFLLVHRGNAVIDEILLHRAAKEPFLV